MIGSMRTVPVIFGGGLCSVSVDFHFELLLVFGVRLTHAHAVAADDGDFNRSDLNILAAFLAIAEKRSFTKTAKRLAVLLPP